MIKKLFYASLVMLALFTISSCKDYDDSETTQEKKEMADVLVMYYSMGGGNLDNSQVNDIIMDIVNGSSDNVKMTFQYKLSKPNQDSCVSKPYHGVFRMDLDDNKHLVGDTTLNVGNGVIAVLDRLKLENYSQDSEFNICTEKEVASFINWSIEKHPARKYVLVVADHGDGWTVSEDGYAEAQTEPYTRAMCYDDNIYDTDVITSRKLTNAIKRSNLPGGRLDCLICDCCLMAQWENIAEYADAIDCLLASVETSFGNEHYHLLPSIRKNPTDIMNALKDEVNLTIDMIDSLAAKYNAIVTTDFSIYDLKKTNLMLTKIANMKDELVKHWDAEVDSAAINGAIVTALIPNNSDLSIDVKVYNLLVQCMGDSIFKDKVQKKGDYILIDAFTLMQVYVTGAGYKVPQDILDNLYNTFYQTPTPVCLGSFFKELNDRLEDPAFTRLYYDFYSSLKDFAYMRMTQQGTLDPYVNVSPSIVFRSMSQSQSYIYRQSTFDKAVGWSKWLGKTKYFPNYLTNRFRQEL